ncbi:hypothetical protein [Apibacter sp. HY039]|uniref:hypothetical protein n=1 Tax=Apibacter sp. HY039 TaxID=2501476 RepID=UPI000FEC1506|nr:hypothetical protein [Apibacter sp. HY039]
MKNKICNRIIVILTFFIFNGIYSQNSSFDIIGNWMAEDYWGSKSMMAFSEDSYLSLTIDGEMVDGENFIIKGGVNDKKKGGLKYEINFEITPIELYVIPSIGEEVKDKILFGYLKFIDDNNILLKVSLDKNEKTEFEEEGEQIMTLRKIK